MEEYNIEERVEKFNEDQMKYVEIFKEMERGAEVLPFIGKGTVMLKEDIGEVVVNASFDGTEEGMDSNFSNTTEEFYNKLRVGDEVEVVMIGFNNYVLPKANTEYAEGRPEEVRHKYPEMENMEEYKIWEKSQKLSIQGESVPYILAFIMTAITGVLGFVGGESVGVFAGSALIAWIGVYGFSKFGVRRHTKRMLRENKGSMFSTEATVKYKVLEGMPRLGLDKDGIELFVDVPREIAEKCEIGDKVVYFKNLGLSGAVPLKGIA